MKTFESLTESEVLSLAISLEEEDARIYDAFATGLRQTQPSEAAEFDHMREEENGHRHRLTELFRTRFGDHLPLIRRQDVKGFLQRKPVWLSHPLALKSAREMSETMELESKRFYEAVARRTTDTRVRQLLDDLAEEERKHIILAASMGAKPETEAAADEKAKKRLFLLQVVQPGLAGLMDGSVSTLAPIFAAVFATHSSHDTFLVGMAASIGAGISMGFAEAMSDDGSLTGRGRPWTRGAVCGVMTAAGGLGHTLPFLIPAVHLATAVAICVVAVELGFIAWIRRRFMDTPLLSAIFQVVLGGFLVFLAGILIGSS
jgi:rubrerythrin